MLKWRAALVLLIAVISTSVGMMLSNAPDSGLSRAEFVIRDALARNGRSAPSNEKLIFLAIDTASISLDANADLKELFGIKDLSTPEAQALMEMSEHWPWPRSVYARILDRLIGAGA